MLGCVVGLHVELGQLEPCKALALRLGHGYCGKVGSQKEAIEVLSFFHPLITNLSDLK